jgi:hypothetical protein
MGHAIRFQFSRTIVRGAEATGINSGWKKPAKHLSSGQPNEHAMIFPQRTITSIPLCLLDVPAVLDREPQSPSSEDC